MAGAVKICRKQVFFDKGNIDYACTEQIIHSARLQHSFQARMLLLK